MKKLMFILVFHGSLLALQPSLAGFVSNRMPAGGEAAKETTPPSAQDFINGLALTATGKQCPTGIPINSVPKITVKPIDHPAKKPISLSRGFGLGYAG